MQSREGEKQEVSSGFNYIWSFFFLLQSVSRSADLQKLRDIMGNYIENADLFLYADRSGH